MTIWDRVYEDICKNCVIIEGIPLTDFRIFLLGSFVFIGVEIVIFFNRVCSFISIVSISLSSVRYLD